MIPAPRPIAHGTATSADGTGIAWYRYGGGERTILAPAPRGSYVSTSACDSSAATWYPTTRASTRFHVGTAMPSARLEVIPGGGHRPDVRSPELVNPLLLDFLLGSAPSDRR